MFCFAFLQFISHAQHNGLSVPFLTLYQVPVLAFEIRHTVCMRTFMGITEQWNIQQVRSLGKYTHATLEAFFYRCVQLEIPVFPNIIIKIVRDFTQALARVTSGYLTFPTVFRTLEKQGKICHMTSTGGRSSLPYLP